MEFEWDPSKAAENLRIISARILTRHKRIAYEETRK